jgi:negative regulator of sigma E activity
MMDPQEDSDARLERLRLATAAVRPRRDFAARVAAAVDRDNTPPAGWLGDLSRAAWRLVPIAALAAAVGVVWAAQSQRAWHDAVTALGAAEVDTEW